jgi:hypothetical protein
MDASTTCALVSTKPFSNYNQIVGSNTTLIEFNMTSNYVLFKNSVVNTNAFTTYLTSKFSSSALPALPSGCNSIVTGYLGYPISSNHDKDYRVTSAATGYTLFPDAASRLSNVSAIVTAGDLCGSNEIYNSTTYTGTNIGSLSLAALYQTLAGSNSDATKISLQSNIDRLQNKNKTFFSFFVYEYCYYNTMYTKLVEEYFNEYSSRSNASLSNISFLKDSAGTACVSGGTGSTAAQQTSRMEGIVITLSRVNSRLTDMRNLLGAINTYYSTSLQSLQGILNANSNRGSDAEVEAQIVALRNQVTSSLNAQDQTAFRQGIVEYTNEKNRYSNILLGIYAFLNIAIIAVIFNIKE